MTPQGTRGTSSRLSGCIGLLGRVATAQSDLSQSVQANVGIESLLGRGHFLPNPSQFIRLLAIIRRYIV
jgi:hypothetical protein